MPAILTTTYPLANSLKLKQMTSSTQRQTSEQVRQYLTLKRPNPPTPEAIKKAQFVDKTYKWSGK